MTPGQHGCGEDQGCEPLPVAPVPVLGLSIAPWAPPHAALVAVPLIMFTVLCGPLLSPKSASAQSCHGVATASAAQASPAGPRTSPGAGVTAVQEPWQ